MITHFNKTFLEFLTVRKVNSLQEKNSCQILSGLLEILFELKKTLCSNSSVLLNVVNTGVVVEKLILLCKLDDIKLGSVKICSWPWWLSHYLELLFHLFSGWFNFLQEAEKSGHSWKTIEEVAKGRPDIFLTKTRVPCYMYSQQARTGER